VGYFVKEVWRWCRISPSILLLSVLFHQSSIFILHSFRTNVSLNKTLSSSTSLGRGGRGTVQASRFAEPRSLTYVV
jgi:hypothetical protein